MCTEVLYLSWYVLETCQKVLSSWQTIDTYIKCCRLEHFIKVSTICQDKINLQEQKYNIIRIITCDPWIYKMDNPSSIQARSQAEARKPELQHQIGLDARNPDFVACEQQGRRSACASVQSDQRLCYLVSEN